MVGRVVRTMLPSSSFGIFSKNRMSLSRSFSELFVTQLSLDELLDEEKKHTRPSKTRLGEIYATQAFHLSESASPLKKPATNTDGKTMDKEIEVRSQNLRIGKDRKA